MATIGETVTTFTEEHSSDDFLDTEKGSEENQYSQTIPAGNENYAYDGEIDMRRGHEESPMFSIRECSDKIVSIVCGSNFQQDAILVNIDNTAHSSNKRKWVYSGDTNGGGPGNVNRTPTDDDELSRQDTTPNSGDTFANIRR